VACALSDKMKNHQPWMTVKDTDNQYGWLSQRQLGFLSNILDLKAN